MVVIVGHRRKGIQMYTVTKRIEIAGSHRLKLPYDSPCTRLHGHNWIIEVEVIAGILTTQGMVVDFTNISKVVRQLDHRDLNEMFTFNPTAENIAEWIFNNVKKTLDNSHAEVSKVTVQESEGNIACYTP